MSSPAGQLDQQQTSIAVASPPPVQQHGDDQDVQTISPPTAKRARISTQDDRVFQCIFCFEPCGNTGDHQLAATSCGHLFGYACIAQWLNEHKKCPTCNQKALRKHLYRLYGVPVLGVAEHSALQELQDTNKALQLDMRELRRTLGQQTQLAQDLQAQVQQLQAQLQLAGAPTARPAGWRHPTTFVERLCVTGLQGARCLQVDGPTGRLLVAEHPAQQHCHIRKTNCLNHAVSEQLPLPAGCVRDMQLSSDGAQLLVAGTRWLNILHVGSGNTAASLAIPLQAWSCCWDAVDANAVHVGMQQGALLTFDVRHPAMPLTSHTPPAGVPPTPLHTLVAAPTGGLLTATYTAVVAWEGGAGGSQGSTTWQPRVLVEAPSQCTAMAAHAGTLIASVRQSSSGHPAAHLAYTLADAGAPLQPGTVMRHGAASAIMGRPALQSWTEVLPGQEHTLLFASGDTCNHCVELWDVRHGRLLHNLRPMPEAVRQVELQSVMDVYCVATVSETMLRLETLM